MYLEFALTNAPPICFSANAKAASIAITSRTGRQRPAPAYCELLRAPKPVFRCCRAKARTCQSRCRPVAQAALVRAGPTYKSRPGSRARSGNCQWPGAAYHLSEIDGGPEITPHRRHRNARTSQPFCPHSVGQLECINERLGFAGLGVTRTRTRTRRTRPRPRIRWTRTNLDSDSDSSDSDSDSPDLDSDSDSPDSDSDSPDSRFPVRQACTVQRYRSQEERRPRPTALYPATRTPLRDSPTTQRPLSRPPGPVGVSDVSLHRDHPGPRPR